MVENTDNGKSFKLEVENEFRILVGENSTDVKIELSSGLAEIYGTEMEVNKEYSLSPNSSIAIFTWHGCVIKVRGKPEASYIVSDSAMILNVVLHASLEERRIQAKALNKKGPAILVVGPNNSGKDMLCRLLLNYAARLGRRPLFIDLDVGQNSISIPGTIGILAIEKPADIVAGFDDKAVQVYQFGYKMPYENLRLYLFLLKKLGQSLQSGLRQTNENVRTSGIVINGNEYIKQQLRTHGCDALPLVALNSEIDILCVMHDENLYLQLQSVIPSSIKLIFFPKIDQIMRNNRHIRKQLQETGIRSYFFGATNQLQPFTFEVNYSDIQVFKLKIKQNKMGEQSLVDITQKDAKLKRINLSENLVHHIFGLSSADDIQKDVSCLHVIGFICVTNVDISRNTITVLSPQPSPLPKKILLWSNIRFIDNQ